MGKRAGIPAFNTGRFMREDDEHINIADVITRGLAPFGESITVSPQALFELKSTYGTSVLRDVENITGGGSISLEGGVFKLETSASADDVTELRTAERGRYVPGIGAQAGFGVEIPADKTGEQKVQAGLFDDSDGYFFEQDSTGLSVNIRSGGSLTKKIRRDDWNVDKLDGSGPSEVTLDLDRGNIFRITYSWYGYGVVEFQVVVPDPKNEQMVVTVHRYVPQDGVSTENPNLPITIRLENGATASAHTAFVAGRNFSLLGSYTPNVRINGERRLSQGSIGTTVVPFITFRHKTGRFENVSLKVRGFDIISDADLEVLLLLDPSLTDASFGTPTLTTASETAAEVDISATALTGGEVIWRGLVKGGTGSSSTMRTEELQGLQIPPATNTGLCLAGRRISGTNATVSSLLRYKEEW